MNPIFRNLLLILCCFCCISLINGCGSSDRPELGQVQGTVTLGGKPLEGARITFMPKKTRGGSAVTDAAGRYQLIYLRDIPGAPIGQHKVFLSKLVEEHESIPEKYSNPDTTELTAEVKAGSNTIDFNLE